MKEAVNTYVIDLFCGAGGTSTAIFKSKTNIKVVACINHDKNAILSHVENNKDCIHFIEDIRTIGLQPIMDIVDKLRREDPTCLIAVWASLECTNYSRAKGGLPRDADSRSLADHLFRYIEALNPDFLWIENVREFMAWGPLDAEGKPLSHEKGVDYERWVQEVRDYGYTFDWKLLNSADYEGYTSRTRYFGQFAKNTDLISWPKATRSSKKVKGQADLFNTPLKPWKPVKDVLDLEDEGNSIFGRKKPLVENTLKRIYAGLEKFVANGEDTFIKKYYSGRPAGKVISVQGPAGTVTTKGGQAVVKTLFMSTYYGNSGLTSIGTSCPTLTTKDRVCKNIVKFMDNQYNSSKPTSLNVPNGTLTTVPKQSIVRAEPYIMNANSSTSPSRSIDNPCVTITQRRHYLVNPQYGSKGGSIHKPCFTLIARMDKSPPYLVTSEYGAAIIIHKEDSEMMIKIKQFMAAYGIADIKMRMLKIPEMLKIQGFPDGYKLIGTQTEQKKYIGNSVEVNVGIALFTSIDNAIQLRAVA